METYKNLIPKNYPKKTDVLVFDYSVFIMRAINIVRADGYAEKVLEHEGRKAFSDIMSEVKHVVAKEMLRVSTFVNADKTYIAMDSSPYWRTEFLDNYYRSNTTVYWNPYDPSGEQYITEVDGKVQYSVYDGEIGKWVIKTLTKDLQKELDMDFAKGEISEQWFKFDKGLLSEEEALRVATAYKKDVSDVCRDVYQYPMFTQLHLFDELTIFPRYKGKRSWKHGAVISKEDFVATMRLMAHGIAPFLEAQTPMAVEGMEADDIIHGIVNDAAQRGETVTVASIDSDLQQLQYHYGNCRFILPSNEMVDFLDKSDAVIELEYWKKVLGGDSSDNVRGVRKVKRRKSDNVITSTTGTMGEKTAENFVIQFRSSIQEKIETDLDPVTLGKNRTVVDLRNIPSDLYNTFVETLAETTSAMVPQIEDKDGTRKDPDWSVIFIGMDDISRIKGDIEIGVCDDVYTEVVDCKDETVVDTPTPVAPVTILYHFQINVGAHPTNTQFPAWSAGTYQAKNVGDALSKAKEAVPTFGEHYRFDPDSGDHWWWECSVEILDMGEV